MPTIWENSYVDRLRTLYDRKAAQTAVEDVRRAIELLGPPDSAKILAAIATDVITGIQSRNDRADVNDACAVLRTAIALLEAIDPNLDG